MSGLEYDGQVSAITPGETVLPEEMAWLGIIESVRYLKSVGALKDPAPPEQIPTAEAA